MKLFGHGEREETGKGGRERRTDTTNDERDAEARARLPGLPDMEEGWGEEEEDEDDRGGHGRDIFPEVVVAAEGFEFRHDGGMAGFPLL